MVLQASTGVECAEDLASDGAGVNPHLGEVARLAQSVEHLARWESDKHYLHYNRVNMLDGAMGWISRESHSLHIVVLGYSTVQSPISRVETEMVSPWQQHYFLQFLAARILRNLH